METMSRGGPSLPTSLSGGGLAHIGAEVRSKVNEEVFAQFCENKGLLQVCFVGFLLLLQYNVKSPVKRRSGIFPRLLSVDSQTDRHNQRR